MGQYDAGEYTTKLMVETKNQRDGFVRRYGHLLGILDAILNSKSKDHRDWAIESARVVLEIDAAESAEVDELRPRHAVTGEDTSHTICGMASNSVKVAESWGDVTCSACSPRTPRAHPVSENVVEPGEPHE